jgi:hypothetical protein
MPEVNVVQHIAGPTVRGVQRTTLVTCRFARGACDCDQRVAAGVVIANALSDACEDRRFKVRFIAARYFGQRGLWMGA